MVTKTRIVIVLVALYLIYIYRQSRAGKARRRAWSKANQGKVFIVTGGASGIGKHLTQKLLSEGHCVISTDLNEKVLKDLGAAWEAQWPGHIYVLKHDIRSAEEWRGVIDLTKEKFQRIDYLLNVAGYIRPGAVTQFDENQIHMHLDINAKGPIIGSQLVAAEMVKQKSGHIVNICSTAAIFFPTGISLYCASKHAIRGFTRALAFELEGTGVHVTSVCPDPVQTPMLELQYNYKDAAITFSAPYILTVEDVEAEIFQRVFPLKPHEIVIKEYRGALAHISYFAPQWLYSYIMKLQLRRGQEVQKQLSSSELDTSRDRN